MKAHSRLDSILMVWVCKDFAECDAVVFVLDLNCNISIGTPNFVSIYTP